MKKIILGLIVSSTVFSCNIGRDQSGTSIITDSIPSTQQIIKAWTYLYGRYLVIQQENLDIVQGNAGYNKIKYNPLSSALFVNPNLDVAYLEAWIAVDSLHSVVLQIPEIKDRYYTAEILDGWGEVITNINERNYPKTPFGRFAFVLKGTHPPVPEDAVRIELPAPKAKMLARVELKGTPAVAQKLQKEFVLFVPDSMDIAVPPKIPEFTPAKPIGGVLFETAGDVIRSYPDQMPDALVFQKEAVKVERFYKSNPGARTYVDSIVSSLAIPAFLNSAKGFGTQKGGWSVSYVAGKFGNNIMARDIINYGGLWANTIGEAIYFVGLTDDSKQMLNGSNEYVIHFPAGARPDSMVNAFWSVTLYSVPDYRVVDNPLKRYGLNNVSGLKTNADGSFSIWLGPAPPSGIPKTNWLPTPAGKGFALTFRMYVSKEEVLNGNWFPPPIKQYLP